MENPSSATVGSKMVEMYFCTRRWDIRWDPWPLTILGNVVAFRLSKMLRSWPNCFPPGIDTTFDDRDANIAYENNIRAFLQELFWDVVVATNNFEMPLPQSEWERLQLPARLQYAILLSHDNRRVPPFQGGGGNRCMMCNRIQIDEDQLAEIDRSETTPVVYLDVRISDNRGGQWIAMSLSLLPGFATLAPRYCDFHLFVMKRMFRILMAFPP